MSEYRIGKYIILRLFKEKTIIFIENKEFIQCKRLILDIPTKKIKNFDSIQSIDDLEDKFKNTYDVSENLLNPIEEFWAHCSNLQVWWENDYDSHILHSNLAFPLLKELMNVGDHRASQRLKEEIVHRLAEGNINVAIYLISEGYLDFLNSHEWENVAIDEELDIIKKLIRFLDQIFREDELLADYVVDIIENLSKKEEIREIIKRTIFNLMYYDSDYILAEIVSYKLYRFLDLGDLKRLFESSNSKLIDNLKMSLLSGEHNYSKNTTYVFITILIFLNKIYQDFGEIYILKLRKNLKEEQRLQLAIKLNNFIDDLSDKGYKERALREADGQIELFLDYLKKVL